MSLIDLRIKKKKKSRMAIDFKILLITQATIV